MEPLYKGHGGTTKRFLYTKDRVLYSLIHHHHHQINLIRVSSRPAVYNITIFIFFFASPPLLPFPSLCFDSPLNSFLSHTPSLPPSLPLPPPLLLLLPTQRWDRSIQQVATDSRHVGARRPAETEDPGLEVTETGSPDTQPPP